jgi:IS605 OrfB family transposase
MDPKTSEQIMNLKTGEPVTREIYVNSHILDYAIHDALNRYKACLTNLQKGNIRSFRLRYLKSNKPNKIFKVEKLAVRKEGFCTQALGSIMKCEDRDFNYLKNFTTVAIVKYDKPTDQFYWFVKYLQPKLENEPEYANRTDTIALDPGIRTYLTGFASNGIVEIGTSETMQKDVERQLKLIDSINNSNKLTKKQKQKAVNKRYTKLKNQINDVQWKTADYLTKNYTAISIGNFSTKDMGESDTVTDMTKRIGNLFSFFEFKQILQYKSFKTGTQYKHIEEAFTSKCCSRCGYCKNDLGSAKVFDCNKCRLKIKRDVNGAKNILLLSL